MTIRILPLTKQDGVLLQNSLRPWDAFECAMHDASAATFVEQWIDQWSRAPHVTALSVWRGDALCACMGVRPYYADYETGAVNGKIWLLATKQSQGHPRAWWRMSCRIMDMLTEQYDVLCNTIPEERHESRRWLTALGFDFGPAFLHPSGVRVLPFEWRRDIGPTRRRRPQ